MTDNHLILNRIIKEKLLDLIGAIARAVRVEDDGYGFPIRIIEIDLPLVDQIKAIQ